MLECEATVGRDTLVSRSVPKNSLEASAVQYDAGWKTQIIDMICFIWELALDHLISNIFFCDEPARSVLESDKEDLGDMLGEVKPLKVHSAVKKDMSIFKFLQDTTIRAISYQNLFICI